jgi:hypothetical protein
MDAKTLVEVLKALPTQQAVLIRADHGVGKSQIVKSIAQGKDVIDVRASTMTEGDVVGYPNLELTKELGVALFALPAWYVRACREGVVLFLDELNRGLPGVLNSFFQIILDREMGHDAHGKPMQLHPDTRVIAAVNWGDDYTVNEMDPALLSRFWVADYSPTMEDWLTWADAHEIDPAIKDFIRLHPNHLRPKDKVEPGKVCPNPRAWEMLNRAIRNTPLSDCEGNPPALLYPVAMGFVGVESASALVDFVKNYSSVLTAEDILQKWSPTMKQRVEIATTEKHLAVVQKIHHHATRNTWSAAEVENLYAFFTLLPGDLKINLYNGVASSRMENSVAFKKHAWPEIQAILRKAENMRK